MTDKKWYMAGTEKTGLYHVIAITGLGTMGLREYAMGRFRIRVEPTVEGMFALESRFKRSDGWKQPGDNEARENRFSKTVAGPLGDRAELLRLVKFVLWTLVSDGRPFELNPAGANWATRLLSHDVMVAEVRALKVPGCNFASRWSTATLANYLVK